VTGDGSHAGWAGSEWQGLERVGSGIARYTTRCKVAYSTTGLYFLFECQDEKLQCSGLPDFADLYTEDVIEVFLWPDEQHPLYLEYEISPFGAELPILVSKQGGTFGAFHGWLPWHYEGARRCCKATAIRGGAPMPGASVTGWTVEFFIPFALFSGVCPTPKAGDRWRANFYRIDYDKLPCSHWAWDTRTDSNFHDYQNFGSIVFGKA